MKAIGIILAGGKNERLGALTANRASSAIPVGSCYRAIDFPISNMANSGINKIAVMTQHNSRSLHDHLSSPKWWDLGTKHGGLFVMSPYLANNNSGWFRGTAESIYQNMTYLRRSKEKYVVIASGDCVYRMDYNDLIAYHERKNAEITIAYRRITDGEDITQYGVVEMDEFSRITDLEEKPLEATSDLASMGVYVMERTLLIDLLNSIIPEGRHDLVRDLLARYRKRLRIFGYKFDGYWRSMSNLLAYYDCNMDFLKRDVRNLFVAQPYIKTKPKDEPPAKYNSHAIVSNTLVGSGTIIDGTVENSVLFRKVKVNPFANVRHSIVLEGTEIGSGCTVEYAVLDKEVIIRPNTQVIGTPESPAVVPKGTVV